MANRKHIALVGFMGAGKSTVARMLSERHNLELVDIDERIETKEQLKIGEIFEEYGEQHFRELETDVLRQALESDKPSVIACGGGIVTKPENMVLLERYAVVVYLSVSVDCALARIDDVNSRPLLAAAGSTEVVFALMQSRMALYETAADVAVTSTKRTPEEVVEVVERRLKDAGYEGLFNDE